MIVIPSGNIYQQFISTLYAESFFVELDSTGVIYLYLKLLPKNIISIMNGVQIELVIRNPGIMQNSITLYIKDVYEAPIYITKTSKKFFPSIEKLSKFLVNEKIRIVILDQVFQCVYANDYDIMIPNKNLEKWHDELMKESTVPIFDFDNPKEDDRTGYMIRIHKKKADKFVRYTNLGTKRTWGVDPYTISTNRDDSWFNIENYIKKGTIGYFQEQMLKNFLGQYFKPNKQLFYSIKTNNREELTDFIIVSNGMIILIESKTDSAFDKYPAKANAKEKSITSLIHKAAEQLYNAKKIIKENKKVIDNVDFVNSCNNCDIIFSLCLLSDISLVNTGSLKESLKIYDKLDIPLILSVETFIEIILHSKTQCEICKMLINIYRDVMFNKDLEIPMLAGIEYQN